MAEKLVNLSPGEREDLERRYKRTPTRRISERIQAILLLDDGHSREQVARIVQVNPKTITRWVHTFDELGIDMLCTLQYAGNVGALSPAQQAQLADWLAAEHRSIQEARAWVEQRFCVRYTESGMRKLLARIYARDGVAVPVPRAAPGGASSAWQRHSLK
ncbi:MAG TPA: helix-turn-helix domain-containing protein [Roseiflexaceae bacterium]|nr:helix-turn-helix domain-containing protein [Roseiflexaceae bacterium]